ncbi:MAG: diguanylate cyclase [Candidatus Izemoplasmatales bacterium]
MKKWLGVILLILVVIIGRSSAVKAETFSADFLLTIDNNGVIMFIVNPDTGMIVYSNQAAESFYGYSSEEFLLMNINEINTLTDEEIIEEMNKALEEERNYFLFEHQNKIGEIKNVEVYSYPINYEGKTYLYSIIIDITERVELERQNRILLILFSVVGSLMITGLVLFIITLRKNHQYLLAEHNSLLVSHEMSETFFDAISKMIFIKDEFGKFVFVNPAYQDYLGLEKNEIIGKTDQELGLLSQMKTSIPFEVLSKNKADNKEIILIKQKNHYYEQTTFYVKIHLSHFGLAGFIQDVTESKRYEKEIIDASYHDLLTGLFNRNYLEKSIEQKMQTDQYPMGVYLLDVNGLKFTNDVFGHAEGDILLKEIAKVLTKVFGSSSTLCRYGGDEFIVISTNASEEIMKVQEGKIKQLFGAYQRFGIPGSVSVGTAIIHDDHTHIQDAISDAETAMYTRKTLDRKMFKEESLKKLIGKLHKEVPFEKAHSQVTSKLLYDFALYLGLPENDANTLKTVGYYHDIGKVVFLDQFELDKKKMSSEEKKLLQTHTIFGYRILNYSDELMHIASIALEHHERYDGLGYPKKLKKDQISKFARILSVVECYDVMTSKFSYKTTLTFEQALEEINKEKGHQFDPYYVTRFSEFISKIYQNKK